MGTKGFFLSHQAVMGFLSGLIFGLVSKTFGQIVGLTPALQKYPTTTIVLILLFMLGFAAHFCINGHIKLISNNASLKKNYQIETTAFQIRLVRVLFWILFALGFLIGISGRNEFFFWPA